MLFSLREAGHWFGVTPFEMLMQLIAITVYSLLVALKIEGVGASSLSWWTIHIPLFVCDAFSAYYCIIILIRQHLEGAHKVALFRALWSFNQLVLLFLGKLLLCFKLDGQKHLTHSEVFSPLFFLLLLLVVRACQLH